VNPLRSIWIALALMVVSPLALAQTASEAGESAGENPLAELNWIEGPTEVTVLGQAKLKVPEGYVYLDREDTVRFQELMQNISSGNETVLAPMDLGWFALFEFDESGYVKDDEAIDKDAVLKSVRDGTEASNPERRRRGWGEMHVVGWKVEPHYDTTTKRLEWAIIGRSDDGDTINFNTRLLGRKGVMSVVLVASPEDLDAATVAFKDSLTGFEYLSGQRYADVQEGDKIAEYGLAALIAGGAAAVATKKGFWGVLAGFFAAAWKFIGVALVALGAWFRSLFKKKE
jgi:uncharacterized membrane-anchored protein